MQPKNKNDTPALKQRIKQLEKSLEKANVMNYGLSTMIDYAEKELKVPLRKKLGFFIYSNSIPLKFTN